VVWGDGTIDTLAGTATSDSHAYTSTGTAPTKTFTAYVNATDNFGLTGQSSKATKTISDKPPTVSFTESLTSATTGQAIVLTITSSDPDGTVSSLKASWGDGSIDTLAGTAASDSHSYSSSGTFTVYVNATDNSASTTKSVSATKTITGVTINISFTENTTSATTGQSITLTITASESGGTISSLKMVWGDGTVDTLAGTATTDSHAYTSTGSTLTKTFQVYVNATDSTGRTAKSSVATKTITDKPPTVSFTESATSASTGTSITLTITAADSDGTVSSLKVSWGDGTLDILAGTATTDSHAYSTGGSFTVYVNATDNSGSTTKSTSATKTITGVTINVSFTEDTTSAMTGQTITLTISASESGGTISSLKVVWGDGTIDSLAGTATTDSHAYVSTGNSPTKTFQVYVNATDSTGRTGKSSTATKSISDRSPVASFTESTTSSLTGVSISFDATASSDPDGTIASYSWNFGDGNAGTGVTTSHSYAAAGSYTVTLTVTDNSGSTNTAQSTKTISQAINIPPTVTFTEDKTTAKTGETITLTITASDPDDTVASISVDWGDGKIDTLPGTATTATHSYTSTGNAPNKTFTVTVTATDSRGANGTSAPATKLIMDRPPGVSFTESSTTANTGQSITLTITASDPDGTIANIVVYWGDGTVDTLPGTATSDSHAYSIPNTYNIFVNATDNSGLSTWTPIATKTITQVTGASFSLTFQAFDADDFENSVGQLDVWLNGNLVVNIPGGQTGSGDFAAYTNTWISFGPFDLTNLMLQGTNNITFSDPLASHETQVRHVKIVSGGQTILNFPGTREIDPTESLTILFSNPPLHLSSFTASPVPVVEGHIVTFTATYTGGVGPFRCNFNFGDSSTTSIISAGQSCSAVHTYNFDGNFTATVSVRGANINDRAKGAFLVTVTEDATLGLAPALLAGVSTASKFNVRPDD
jgi:PKD repeat protein